MLRALKVQSVALLSDDVRQQQALRSCGVEVVALQARHQKQLQDLEQQQGHAVALGEHKMLVT
jgi:GTP cyclohydrolase II